MIVPAQHCERDGLHGTGLCMYLPVSLSRQTCVLRRGSPLIGAIDEVYPATLLAHRGLDGETDCAGYATSVEFLPHTEHPTSYPAANVSADLCVCSVVTRTRAW